MEVFCTGQGVLNHVIVIHYDDGAMARHHDGEHRFIRISRELLEAMGHGAIVILRSHAGSTHRGHCLRADHQNIIRCSTTGIRMLGSNSDCTEWLKKKRAACEEAEKTGRSHAQLRPSRTKATFVCCKIHPRDSRRASARFARPRMLC